MLSELVELIAGDGPLVAAAIHNGSQLRREVAEFMALAELERLREEDPHTGTWTLVAPTRIVGQRSRFEVDLNRPRETAVYRVPSDAWGLTVWSTDPPVDLVERSLTLYDAFYSGLRQLLETLVAEHGIVIVFDLHSYNHRRNGAAAPAADAESHPEVNLGTGSLDRGRWGPVVDRFLNDLRSFDYLGRPLDVRENVKFLGGHFSRWIHQNFPESVCVLAIEFKKFFMDEWTGRHEWEQVETIRRALESTVAGVLEERQQLCRAKTL